jgi:hypothetical protein
MASATLVNPARYLHERLAKVLKRPRRVQPLPVKVIAQGRSWLNAVRVDATGDWQALWADRHASGEYGPPTRE